MKPIKNTQELRKAIAAGQYEYRLLLNGGVFSRKTIFARSDGRFEVWNGIDDSQQTLTGRQLFSESNIGIGMRRGALIPD